MEEFYTPNFARNMFTVTYCDVDFSHQESFLYGGPSKLQKTSGAAA
jgi:hypothetical protein